MPNVLTVQRTLPQNRSKLVQYGCILSGNYVQVANGGEILNLNGAANPKSLIGASWGLTGPDPTRSGTGYPIQGPGGLAAEVVPGVDALHPILKLFDPTTGNELAAGAYPAKAIDVNFSLAFEGKATD